MFRVVPPYLFRVCIYPVVPLGPDISEYHLFSISLDAKGKSIQPHLQLQTERERIKERNEQPPSSLVPSSTISSIESNIHFNMTSAVPVDFHLRLSGKELLLQEGPVYRRNNFKSIKKVLVVGGGVTGLTVGVCQFFMSPLYS
jgi:hypothetical protein